MKAKTPTQKVIKSDCILCVWGCGINAYVEDGKLIRVEGMPEHPLNKGKLCPRGERLVDYVYSPDRLKYPMKKEGNDWKRITWDEALDTIATKLTALKQAHGAHSLAVYSGSIGVENIELAAFAQRFRGAFGTPNMLSVESTCFRARILAQLMTFGRYNSEDLQNANCIILWGHNPDNSHWQWAGIIRDAIAKGVKLIVIDPKRTPLAKEGRHIQLRPGTDCALALGMLNVIISENLHDAEFVDKWAVGFDRLCEHVKEYTPEKVEEITWVPASDIREVARTYATTKPACIVPGICSLDQQISSIQNTRALAILQTVTGNIDKPGTWAMTPLLKLSDLRVPVDEEPIGAEEYPLFHRLWGRASPYGQAMLFPEVVLTEKPYPIKALIVNGGNPALSFPGSARLEEALRKLELLVVIDPFMSETAQLAHIVLPACTFLEKGGVGYVYAISGGMPYAMLRKKIIEPIAEAWPDWKFWSELGRRMGYGEYFPWTTEEQVIRHLLEPSGVTYEQLMDNPAGVFYASKEFGACEERGFGTPSGKIEIYSETLAKAGFDPIPTHREPTESIVNSPELAREYPLILSTGARILEYTHTQLRNVPWLRARVPEPLAEIHPTTAQQYGISDGDLVAIETRNGSISMKAMLSEDIAPPIVAIPHGWAQANANILTSAASRDPISGYPELKTLACRIRKVHG